MKIEMSWHRVMQNWQRDAKLLVFLVGLMMVFRFAMVAIFYDQRAENGEGLDYVLFFMRALLFDFRIVLMVTLPTFVLAFLSWGAIPFRWLELLRNFIGSVAIIVTVILYVGDIGFFAEYHAQSNHQYY